VLTCSSLGGWRPLLFMPSVKVRGADERLDRATNGAGMRARGDGRAKSRGILTVLAMLSPSIDFSHRRISLMADTLSYAYDSA
jgi:hypothetical protein